MELFQRIVQTQTLLFQIHFLGKTTSLSDNVDQDQTARSVQSDLDLHCPHNVTELLSAASGTSKSFNMDESKILEFCKDCKCLFTARKVVLHGKSFVMRSHSSVG